MYGLNGPIPVKDRVYSGAVMPQQGNILKDYEIAGVLTYVRNSWSNKADPDNAKPAITADEVKSGAQAVMSTCTGPTAPFPISGYFATSTFLQKYPNTARAFQQALDRGQALADSSRSDVEEIMPNYIQGLTANEAAVVNLGNFPTSIDETHLQRVASAMVSGHLVTSNFSVASLLFH